VVHVGALVRMTPLSRVHTMGFALDVNGDTEPVARKIAALDENSSDIQNAAGQTGDENFLIVGSDTRAGATAEENVGDADTVGGARSDTIMLAHVPADRKRAVIVSFPRDLEISRPACERYDAAAGTYTSEIVSAATKVKLNTAYAVGGPKCLTKWVQQLTGLRVNHFVGIDFSGFKDMVDAVGVVTVHVDAPIKDTVLGMVVSQTGDVTISGDQALSFVRARHVIGDITEQSRHRHRPGRHSHHQPPRARIA